MTEKDRTVNFDFNATLKSDVHMVIVMLSNHAKQAKAVFSNEKLAKEFLPAVALVSALSVGQQIEQNYDGPYSQNHHVRPIRYKEIKGANHFVSVSSFIFPRTNPV
jgi:hypothetical protein